MIDLLALYKLNVLHMHLTDDQSWRLPVGRADGSGEPDAAFYGAEDLRALIAYAADRFVTVVPEVDMPGHVSALLRMRPELNSGRNQVEFHGAPCRMARPGPARDVPAGGRRADRRGRDLPEPVPPPRR